MSYQTVSEIIAERDQLRADLAREIKEHDLATTFHTIAIKERDFERMRCGRLEADLAAARALLREFRKATQFESNGQMYTLSGIPRELTRRIDAALAGKDKT